MIADISQWILGLHGWAALAIVFAVPMLECSAFVGFVFPGEIAILLGGALASQHRVPLLAVAAAATTGAILGDTIGYAVGRRWGRRLLYGSLGRIIKHRHLDRAERYLAERGGKAVFFGRHTAALRVLIPGAAGMARMPYRTFALYNILGGLVWAVWNTLLGYIAGAGWKHAAALTTRISLLILAVLLLVAGLVAAIKTLRRRTDTLHTVGRRLAGTRPAAWVRRRLPRQLAWAHRRLDPTTPAGLPLTAALTTAALCAWTFAGLTEDVLADEELARLDPRVNALGLGHRTGWLTAVMQTATWLGSSVIIVPLLAAASVYLLRARRDVRAAGYLWAAFGGSVILYETFKSMVGRARPPAAQMILHAGGYAYPSGHTTQAVTTWGLLAFMLVTGHPARSSRSRTLILATATTVTLLVGVSRIYLGAHWFTDVLGGYTLGAAWLALIITHRLRHGQTDPGQNVVPSPNGQRESAQHWSEKL
jgi:undecaprenyl-diphosphatase